jgi:hypothetical protein
MPDDLILQWGSPALYERATAVVSFDDLLRAQARRLRHRLLQATAPGWRRRRSAPCAGCSRSGSAQSMRPKCSAVRVVGFDVEGAERELECEGFGASLMQHEIDHLDGILTLHRAEPAERYRAIAALLAIGAHPLADAA